MQITADLHVHSKYSRAVSPSMELRTMGEWGEKKGIDLMATSDWTHPLWFKEIETFLEEDGKGIFKLKKSKCKTRFILSTEIANIYTFGGRGRRMHTVFMAPSLETARKINTELKRKGGNLSSDGRPILGLSVQDMCEVVWGIDEKVVIMPAHIWTPWFSLFGSKSGFDSVEECFGKYADRIKAIETGLSSDPIMNWKIKDLDKRAIVSCSDAHSPKKLGRELTVFKLDKKEKFTFKDIAEGLDRESGGKCKIAYTIEFHPEEGKYHYTGHRNCQVVQSPEETRKKGTSCHVCGKQLTVGVMHRVEELAGERRDILVVKKENKNKVMGYFNGKDNKRPPYVMLVPLQEIISEVVGVGVNSKKVEEMYEQLVKSLGNELKVLLKADLKEIIGVGGERMGQAIEKVRKGKIAINPGYDGVFGEVKIWSSEEKEDKTVDASDQQTLF